MADNNALLASMLMAQQQRNNPADSSRRYAQLLMQQSLQQPKTPVQSPMEGVARALQQGLGGLIGGIQQGRDEARQALTSQGLIEYANAKPGSPEMAAAEEKLKGADPSIVGAIAAQQIGLNQAQRMATASADNFDTAVGGGKAGTIGAPITAQSTAPLPAPQTGQQTDIPGQDPYQKVLSGYEATNDPNAVNPQSKAGGLYQFVPQTWNSVRQNHPELNLPATVGDASIDQQNAAEKAFRAQNATDLQNNGIAPTPANLYLAHRSGSGGAAMLLKADPNAPMSSVAPPSWLAQNPDMRTTVGQFLAMTQQRFPATLLQGPPAQPGSPQAPPLAQTPSGTKVDPSIPPPPFMQTGAAGGPAIPKLPDGTPVTDGAPPPTTALNVPNAVPPAVVPPAAVPPAAVPPTTGAVPNAPPTVPMPAPTAEQIQRYHTILNDPRSGKTSGQALQELNAELRQQQQQQQTIATEAWKQQKAEEAAKTASVRKAPELFIANTLDDYKKNIRPQAEQAVAGIQNGYQVKQLLDQGAFTGAGADSAVALAHVKQMLGMDPNAKISNTQVLQSQLANGVLQNMGGKLSAGASKADNQFIQNAPNITWDEQSLRKLVDINQREMQRRIDLHDTTATQILKFEGMDAPGMRENFQLQKPPSYEDWQKQNAPQAAAQQPGTAPAASAAVPGSSREAPIPVTDPTAARKLGSGTWISTPDGRIGRVP